MAKTASIEQEYDAIEAMGGIQRIYITDFHFAGVHVQDVSLKFGAGVYCSQVEASKIKKNGIQNLIAFAYTRHDIEEHLTSIPTPGHTPGGVCYLLTLDEKRYLFTGDFLYFDAEKWLVGSKNFAKVKESLASLRSSDYDYLVGCGDDALGNPYVALTSDTKHLFFETVMSQFK
ncbi:MAG: MBL fold metallo-hydrolase [Chitinophagaceae bacterium]|nr:MBL fold metallo-hydrolase [Anaerolineae bacterium]